MSTSQQNQHLRAPSLSERAYLFLDLIGKRCFEAWDDIYTLVVLAGGGLVAFMIRLVTSFLVWSLNRESGLMAFPINLIKTAVGILLSAFALLISLTALIFTGSLASSFGLRNLGDYTLKEQAVAWVGLLAIFAIIPFFVPPYALFKITLVFAYGVGVIGLDLLYGQCGIISLGHAGFLLLGGYVTTWLANGMFGFELPYLASATVAALSMGLVGLLLGAPSLRIKDYYLVIVTMTFSMAIPKIMKSPYLTRLSGLREGGISLREMKPYAFLHAASPAVTTYFTIAVPSVILFVIAYNVIHHSRIGRGFKTVRCDAEVSMIMGIPVVKYKLMAFVLSAIYGGFCGAFLNILTKFIHPETYSLTNSIDFLVGNVLGGPGTVLGSFIGGAFLSYEPDLTLKLSKLIPGGKDLASAFYGLILIFCIFFVPKGIAGHLGAWLKTKLQAPGRRGLYHFSPPSDYDFLPEDKAMNPET